VPLPSIRVARRIPHSSAFVNAVATAAFAAAVVSMALRLQPDVEQLVSPSVEFGDEPGQLFP